MSYRQQDDVRQEALRFNSLGVATTERDLGVFVSRERGKRPASPPPRDLLEAIQRYQDSGDVVTLARIRKHSPGHRWERVIDRDSRQSFLVLFDQHEQVQLVANLNPRRRDAAIRVGPDAADSRLIARFIETRSALLEFEAVE
jgi:hypothetical protein